jgi:UDP-2-acetamido-2,6-beta-L-arabino-hexul-4-ose reductase
MKVLITGANGFVGKNLQLHLSERPDVKVVCFTRNETPEQLIDLLQGVDFVFHLAGVNRPKDPRDFDVVNAGLTHKLCDAVDTVTRATGKPLPILYASSIQAENDNLYGRSKLEAEIALFSASRSHLKPAYIFRLPNVFGKWCKPNYNSVVATFCHNICRDLGIQVNDPLAPVTLVYIDDVIERFVQIMDGPMGEVGSNEFFSVQPEYSATVGDLAEQLKAFRNSRDTLSIAGVGAGLVRALYATYVSFLPVDVFAYDVPQHVDDRGVFVEMLKTADSGQVSFFTACPGVTRGGHYHHSKIEKFLVIKGQARFRFRHVQSGQFHELRTTGDKARIVETVPGWTHDITNTGSDEMVVILWANEVFDRNRPDTFDCPL